MLHEFRFSNHGCFRDEAVLTMEAEGLSDWKNALRKDGTKFFLPAAAIYGKNGGGKTTVLDAFSKSVNFIRTAHQTQYENSPVPVTPFLLDDHSVRESSEYSFVYTMEGVKYWYGFSADREKILAEYLAHAPKGRKAMIFSRDGQTFKFSQNAAQKRRELISEAVAENQLYFSVACTMKDQDCIAAMRWFRRMIAFSGRDFDISEELVRYAHIQEMLDAMALYAKSADVGIDDVRFEVKSVELKGKEDLQSSFPDDMPDSIRTAIENLFEVSANNPDMHAVVNRIIRTNSFHKGVSQDSQTKLYPLPLEYESDGTKKLMSLAPRIEIALRRGGVLIVDELESSMHPELMKFIVGRFQNPETNPNNAQMIFTTHNTELLNAGLLRKDQIYLVDKGRESGAADLYRISDFSTPTHENIHRAYLAGKFGAVPEIEMPEVR